MRFCRGEAIQRAVKQDWIASSQGLLAMTARFNKSRTASFSQKSSNELERCELSVMPRSKSTPTGPMSVQPVQHGSVAPTQLRMEPTVGAETPRPKKQTPRTEAVRIAKARIMRRNSLRKQRQAQKG
jgi:hypothetical protein